jgi:hypothetical protein
VVETFFAIMIFGFLAQTVFIVAMERAAKAAT